MKRAAAPAVVFNPATAQAEVDAMADLMAEYGIEASWYETTADDPGIGQTQAACDDGAGLVIACGGDGTVRACAQALAGGMTPLAIVPAGTGNLLARNLRIPSDVAGAIRVALTGSDRRLDVGLANGEVFLVMAGAGIDAAIMANTSRPAKEAVGALAYVASAARELVSSDPVHAELTVDGALIASRPVQTVLFANCGRVQGFDLVPGADPADGRLDVLAASADGLGEWLRTAGGIVAGKEPDTLMRASGSSMRVVFDRPVPYEVDGDERPPSTRLDIEVSPAALMVRTEEEES